MNVKKKSHWVKVSNLINKYTALKHYNKNNDNNKS